MPKQIGRSLHMMLAPAKGLAKHHRQEPAAARDPAG
jgi:hypothetical protein